MISTAPIGVFDSGVGGLSVLREIRALLPYEHLIYVADCAHVPYGDKPDNHIRARAQALTRFCVDQGAKAIVVACNTATAAAVASLRARFTLPVIAMEPAVKPAVAATRSGVVGVLATTGTLASARFAALLARFGNGTRVVTQPCPGLVEQVERGDLRGPATRDILHRYLAPLLEAGADTIILGCTHYAFLRPLIAELAGPDVALIDTGRAVANQLRRTLAERDLLAAGPEPGTEQFWTSGSAASFDEALTVLWPRTAKARHLPEPAATPV